MMGEKNQPPDLRSQYRNKVKEMGKKEYTLLKMQEYGFWPENLPTPYERQTNETKEQYEKRNALIKEVETIAGEIAKLCQERKEVNAELIRLNEEYNATWDYEKIKKDVSKKILEESVKRRKERKAAHLKQKQEKFQAWLQYKKENIVFIGKGYSGGLMDHNTDEDKLLSLGLPVVKDDKQLAALLDIEYQELRFLAYHRDVVLSDHYHYYAIAKKSGGIRQIAAPKPVLKKAQGNILKLILEKIAIDENVHGFVKERGVLTGANAHEQSPEVLLNMDIENFFPTITFRRVRGMFASFGYSGYIASLLAILCTYCDRVPIEIKNKTRLVNVTGERVLPQGSPASPMITNIICKSLDRRLVKLALQYDFIYTRYADDMSFSFSRKISDKELQGIIFQISCILHDEGFNVNKEKTRYLRGNNRQAITGIVINNESVGVNKKWVRKVRAAIYNANRQRESGNLSQQTINEISGMIAWLSGVNYERYERIILSGRKVIESS